MLKKNLIANYFGQIWNALMSLAFLPVYIHYIGIESYGLIGLFGIVTAWLTLLDMGMTPTLGREIARFTGGGQSAESIRDLLRSIEVIALVIAGLVASSLFSSSHWLATSWLQANELPTAVVAQAFSLMGLITAIRFVEGLYRSSLVGLQRQVLFNIINSVSATLRGLGAIAILTWVSPTIQAFFLWQGLIAIANLLVLRFSVYRILPSISRSAKFSLAILRSIWQYAGGMVGITLLALLLTQVDKILLSKLLTLQQYGYYTLSATVAGALTMLVAPITQAWFPRLTQLYAANDSPGLARTYHEGAQLVTVLMGSACLVLAFFPGLFLQLWTQDLSLAQNSAPLLRLLVMGNLLNGLLWIPYQTQLAYGWTSLAIRINVVSVILIVPAILWATPRYGAIGAAWCWVSLNLGYVLIGIHFMYRRILSTEKWEWYRQDVASPLLATALFLVLLKVFMPAMDSWYGQLSVLSFASVGAFGVALACAHRIRTKVTGVARNFLLKSSF